MPYNSGWNLKAGLPHLRWGGMGSKAITANREAACGGFRIGWLSVGKMVFLLRSFTANNTQSRRATAVHLTLGIVPFPVTAIPRISIQFFPTIL